VSDLRPTEGARFLLELEHTAGAGAEYRVAIYTPDATYSGRATLGMDGGVTLAMQAPAELVEVLEMFAKLTARGAAKRRGDGLTLWPARVLRWRGPGRGS
jgi:hypothetical protein